MSEKKSLSQQAGQSALWQILGGGWQTIVRLGASIIIARVLTPADYGVIGMALLMREFIDHLGSMTMGMGIIAKKSVTDDDLCTCFWSVAAIRFALFLITVSIAPLGGWFFNDPRVTDVVRVVSVTFLFSVLNGVSGTLLHKELKFKTINIISGVLVVLESGMAVALVLTTELGYWVLVIAMLANSFLNNCIIFIAAKWYPKFRFSRESFRYLFRFGINGLGFNITNYLKQNLDYLLVGRLLGTASLGLYEFAYRIPHLVLERISRPVGTVVFPALSKVQNDDQRLSYAYIQVVKYVSLISFPLLFGLAAVADIAVLVLWGEQWLSIITPLRLLCLCAAFRIIPQPVGAVFYCKNRPDIPFKISLFGLIWTGMAVGILSYLYGLVGTAIGMILSLLDGGYAFAIGLKMIKSPIRNLFYEILPILFSSFCCALVAYAVSYLSLTMLRMEYPIILFSSILAGGMAYLLILTIFFPQIIRDTFHTINGILFKNKR